MPLQLDAYYVDRLTFEVVDDWDDDEPESSWDIEVDPQHLRNERGSVHAAGGTLGPVRAGRRQLRAVQG